MVLVLSPLRSEQVDFSLESISLPVDRLRLAKRCWRGTALDGVEFGFDLEHPMRDGTFFHAAKGCLYQVKQLPEPVVEVALPAESREAIRLGWLLGNLHFPLEILPEGLRVVDDPAVRQMLEREGIDYLLAQAVFQPLAGGHTHGS